MAEISDVVVAQPIGSAQFSSDPSGDRPGDTPVDGVTVRTLANTPEDAAFAATLLVEAFRGEIAHNVTEQKLPICHKHLTVLHQRQLPQYYATTFVAELEGKKVGLLHLKFQDSATQGISDHISEMGCWHGCRYRCLWMFEEESTSNGKCLVNHIGVSGEVRGRGVGRLLMKRAEYEARKRQCRMMYLDVLPTNRAIHLYEREGYRVTDTVSLCGLMRCFIGPPGKFYVMEKMLT